MPIKIPRSRVLRFVIDKDNNNFIVRKTTQLTRIKTYGRGAKGENGKDGAGVPIGGLTDQVLSKATDADFDYTWVSNRQADKTYSQNFTVSDFVAVTHSLDKYPAVLVLDSAGDEVEGSVNHVNITELTVSFTYPFSGKVICN